jgi:hypothetical protein
MASNQDDAAAVSIYPDRKNIATMKNIISKTSVSLGNDSLDYMTELMEKEKFIKLSPAKVPDSNLQKQRVAQLNSASWVTGAPDAQSYSTSNTLRDPTGRMGEYTATMNTKAKNALRKSNLHLGNDNTNYRSSAQSAEIKWTPQVIKDTMDGKGNVARMKKVISATNCVLGDDVVDYESNATAAFSFDSSKVIMCTPNEKTKADLRSSHLSLGNDRITYDHLATTNHMSFDPEAARAAKPDQSVIASQVKASHICLGDQRGDWRSATQSQMSSVPACGY